MSEIGKKLRIKSGHSIAIINAPQGYLQLKGPFQDETDVAYELAGSYDLILGFVRTSLDLSDLVPQLLKALKLDSLLWIAYPKKSSGIETDLSRDEGWDAINKAGLRPVAMISIDSSWSAVRFRPKSNESAEEIVACQYSGRKVDLRPIYDYVVEEVSNLGDDVTFAPRKSYVAFARNKQFAVIKASTNSRVDLGLKLRGFPAVGRLTEAGSFGSGSITHKVSLARVDDIDAEVLAWLRKAYDGLA
jgi:predicted transport protein